MRGKGSAWGCTLFSGMGLKVALLILQSCSLVRSTTLQSSTLCRCSLAAMFPGSRFSLDRSMPAGKTTQALCAYALNPSPKYYLISHISLANLQFSGLE